MMVVTDASIVVKWYIEEENTTNAETLLNGSHDLNAPELILPEFGSNIWKKVKRNELLENEGTRIIDAFNKQNIRIHSHRGLPKAAFTGAEMSGQTVYDWTYLALAVSLSCPFVTADSKFFNHMAGTSLKKHLIWIGDL
ncbi:MAG: type II toxin-antitoxin system VapC family toxin [Blastocatellia bacterium]